MSVCYCDDGVISEWMCLGLAILRDQLVKCIKAEVRIIELEYTHLGESKNRELDLSFSGKLLKMDDGESLPFIAELKIKYFLEQYKGLWRPIISHLIINTNNKCNNEKEIVRRSVQFDECENETTIQCDDDIVWNKKHINMHMFLISYKHHLE